MSGPSLSAKGIYRDSRGLWLSAAGAHNHKRFRFDRKSLATWSTIPLSVLGDRPLEAQEVRPDKRRPLSVYYVPDLTAIAKGRRQDDSRPTGPAADRTECSRG